MGAVLLLVSMIALLDSKLGATRAAVAAQTFMLTTMSQFFFDDKDVMYKGDRQVPPTKLSLLQGQLLDKPKPPQTESKFLLSVPFYIYEELIWHNATVAD